MSRKLIYGTPERDDPEIMFRLPDDNGENQDLWISSDMLFAPIKIPMDYMDSGLPGELIEVLSKWEEMVKVELPNFRPGWIEKYSSLKFVYKDEFYVLMPWVVGSTPEFFLPFSRQMKKDLKAMGSKYTQYTGMLD